VRWLVEAFRAPDGPHGATAPWARGAAVTGAVAVLAVGVGAGPVTALVTG